MLAENPPPQVNVPLSTETQLLLGLELIHQLQPGALIINILMTATSYPRSEQDWQGVFIRQIAHALAAKNGVSMSLWAPDGPRQSQIHYRCSNDDQQWLQTLSEQGGIAQLLRKKPFQGGWQGLQLLRRLRRCYRQADDIDLFHINWLQNALALGRSSQPALITVLGTDFKLLHMPGMVPALRRVFKQRRCILAPNADWMVAELERLFGDVARVQAVPFGIDQAYYDVTHQPDKQQQQHWLAVVRITRPKLGTLLEWSEAFFRQHPQQHLHLIGPNQDQLALPDWIHYHGPQSQQQLLQQWFPMASGMITLSQHSEGRPQVLLEAMAAGLPIIASAIDAHRDMIRHAKTGMLVNSRETYIQAIESLSEPQQHQAMSQRARQQVRQHYGNWSDCADRYLQLYRELL